MADEIRQRCGILMQKMTSLRIAVDERMMSFNAMTSDEGGSRPKTAFMRTPRNLSALFDRLAENIAETKHLLAQQTTAAVALGGADGVSGRERNQIRGLIADLERELNRIAPRLNLRSTADTELPAIRNPVVVNESDIGKTDDKEESRSLPSIVCSTFSDPTSVVISPVTFRPNRRHTKTMLLRLQLTKDASMVLKSNQGYPYESSFPKLEPIHPRRFIRERTRTSGGASDSNLSRTTESHETRLKTNEVLRSRRHRYSRSP